MRTGITGEKKMDNGRFIRTYIQKNGFTERMEIWVDRFTGVNYVFTQSGYAGGMTVLLDQDGKPVITPMGHEQK